MKKQIILLLGFLLSFVTVRALDVKAVAPSTQIDISKAAAIQAMPKFALDHAEASSDLVHLLLELRALLASIKASLGQLDTDVAKQIATRTIDFETIKEINKPRGNN